MGRKGTLPLCRNSHVPLIKQFNPFLPHSCLPVLFPLLVTSHHLSICYAQSLPGTVEFNKDGVGVPWCELKWGSCFTGTPSTPPPRPAVTPQTSPWNYLTRSLQSRFPAVIKGQVRFFGAIFALAAQSVGFERVSDFWTCVFAKNPWCLYSRTF